MGTRSNNDNEQKKTHDAVTQFTLNYYFAMIKDTPALPIIHSNDCALVLGKDNENEPDIIHGAIEVSNALKKQFDMFTNVIVMSIDISMLGELIGVLVVGYTKHKFKTETFPFVHNFMLTLNDGSYVINRSMLRFISINPKQTDDSDELTTNVQETSVPLNDVEEFGKDPIELRESQTNTQNTLNQIKVRQDLEGPETYSQLSASTRDIHYQRGFTQNSENIKIPHQDEKTPNFLQRDYNGDKCISDNRNGVSSISETCAKLGKLQINEDKEISNPSVTYSNIGQKSQLTSNTYKPSIQQTRDLTSNESVGVKQLQQPQRTTYGNQNNTPNHQPAGGNDFRQGSTSFSYASIASTTDLNNTNEINSKFTPNVVVQNVHKIKDNHPNVGSRNLRDSAIVKNNLPAGNTKNNHVRPRGSGFVRDEKIPDKSGVSLVFERTVFVRNKDRIDENDLKEKLERFGLVTNIVVISNVTKPEYKYTTAIVEFEDKDATDLAINFSSNNQGNDDNNVLGGYKIEARLPQRNQSSNKYSPRNRRDDVSRRRDKRSFNTSGYSGNRQRNNFDSERDHQRNDIIEGRVGELTSQ